MWAWPKSHRRLLILLGCAAVIALLWYPTAYPRGMLMAYFDLARGHHEIMVNGGPPLPPDAAEKWRIYVQELQERYQVHVNVVTGCVVSDSLLAYEDGYNSVSRSKLMQVNQHDIFEECSRLAKEKWEAANRPD